MTRASTFSSLYSCTAKTWRVGLAAIAGLLALSVAPAAHAGFASGTITGSTGSGPGNIVVLNPSAGGFTVGQDNFNTANLYVFAERMNVLLSADLAIDAATTLAAGTFVNSYMVVFDPLPLSTVSATLRFDEAVLGIARRSATITATNAAFGHPNVTYNAVLAYGLEGGEDFTNLGVPDANSLRIRLSADSPGDVFRVFTQGSGSMAVVPEPTTWAMMILGFAMVGGALRRSGTKRLRQISLSRQVQR